MGERFEVRVHAYVLMDNHYHLLLETRAANLTQAMQWLQVSYTVWFNRRHRRSVISSRALPGDPHRGRSTGWELSRYVT